MDGGKLHYWSTQPHTNGMGENTESFHTLYIARASVPDAGGGTSTPGGGSQPTPAGGTQQPQQSGTQDQPPPAQEKSTPADQPPDASGQIPPPRRFRA